ncbi:MAG: hypothetical protein OXI36_02045 [Gammaproteobacteria bacterium]|nr:hypothetical protein [Gammaproteobacteria bacterium]
MSRESVGCFIGRSLFSESASERFVGLGLKQGPDAKTIHKYRSALADSGRMAELFEAFLSQFQEQGYRLAEGTLIETPGARGVWL